MNLRRLALLVLGVLGLGILLLMGGLATLAYLAGEKFEAAGWLAAGLLSMREVMSKIENVALNVRQLADETPKEI